MNNHVVSGASIMLQTLSSVTAVCVRWSSTGACTALCREPDLQVASPLH